MHLAQSDAECVRRFLRDGYVTIAPTLPADFHRDILGRLESESGPIGDDLLTRLPGVQDLLSDPAVASVLNNVLGPYMLHPHRSAHPNTHALLRDPWHQETHGGAGYKIRNHYPWWAILLYYPQAVDSSMGPTAVLPGSYVLNEFPADSLSVPVIGPPGTCILMHYDLWHRRSRSRSNHRRWAIKLELGRLRCPDSRGDAAQQPNESFSKLDRHSSVPESVLNAHLLWFGLDRETMESEPAVVPSFSSDDWTERLAAVRVQGVQSADARGASALDLANAVYDEHQLVAVASAYKLAELGSAGTNHLGRLTHHPSTNVALRAAHALSATGDEAVPHLIAALRSEAEQTRCFGAFAAGQHRSAADELLVELQLLTHDGSPRVRLAAVEALGMKQATGDAIQRLSDALIDVHPDVRAHAAVALGRLGPSASHVSGALLKLLDDPHGYVAEFGSIALGLVGTS